MENLFVPVDPEDDSMKLVAEKFGDGENIDIKKLARGKVESDRHIATLESELAELRKAVTKQQTVEEILTQIRQATPSSGNNADQQPTVTPPAPQPSLDPDSVKTVFETLLEQKERERTVKTNKQIVSDTLVKKFGPDANIVLNEKARELGVTLEYLSKLAEESPKVFFKTLDIDDRPAPTPVVAPPRSSGTAPAAGGKSVVRDNAYWANIKKTNPSFYFSGEARRLRYNDAMAGHYNP
jgi:hypothetical protein